MSTRIALVIIMLVLTPACMCAVGPSEELAYGFERTMAGWDTDEAERAALAPGNERASEGARSLMLDDGVLAVRRFRCVRSQDWADAATLSYDVYAPAGAPRTVQTAAYVVDSGHRWYQAMAYGFLVPGRWTHVRISLTSPLNRWLPVGHDRPWDAAARGDVAEFGIKVFGYGADYRGPVWLDNVRIERRQAADEVRLHSLRANAERVGRYGPFELTFGLSRTFGNPFDPRQIDIVGHFTAPSGKRTSVRAFWFQDYNRSIVCVDETLTPVGRPEWKLRFTPSEVGEYRYRLEVRAAGDRSGTRRLEAAYDRWSRSSARRWSRLGLAFFMPVTVGRLGRFDGFAWSRALDGLFPARRLVVSTAERRFTCTPSSHPGFVRVSKSDPRFFEYDNGEFLWPRGLNVCAAFDVRNAERLEVMVNRWEGSYALNRFIRNMGRGKANLARLWMACWSLAIEWGEKYDPAFRGPGRYDLANAWRLDLLLEEARRSGTLVQPTLDTFSHFRSAPRNQARDPFMDWSYNAYAVDNGGFVHEPWQFFTNPDCFDFYRRRLEYIVARWGYSPEVFGWEICNEIDLVTRYDSFQQVAWHRKVCDALHAMDPFAHPVTTNFASYLLDYNVWRMPEFDYVTSNRYDRQLPYYFGWLYQDRVFLVENKVGRRRPHLVLEAGNDFRGGDVQTTEDYWHMSLWSAWMHPMAGAGTNWWWVVIDQEDLYAHAEAFERYIRGEDLRGVEWDSEQVDETMGRQPGGGNAALLWADYTPKPPSVVFADEEKATAKHLDLQYMRGPKRMYVWIFDQAALGIVDRTEDIQRIEGVDLVVKDVEPGVYGVEVWDTYKGSVLVEDERPSAGGELVVGLPPFTKDVALKIKYLREPGPEYLADEPPHAASPD